MSTMSTPLTQELNDYLRRDFSVEDDFLRELNQQAEAEGIPAINIAPEQTAFLQILLKSIGARTVVEVGSLAGYSAIVMARALPEGSTLIACEKDPKHAAFIRRKVEECGLADVVTVLEGAATETLALHPLLAEGSQTIDAVFIDADKPNYPTYFDMLYPHIRTGGFVIGDNALAWGQVHLPTPDSEPDNVKALRAFNDRLVAHPGLQTTLVPLGDGMVIGLKLA